MKKKKQKKNTKAEGHSLNKMKRIISGFKNPANYYIENKVIRKVKNG